MMNSNQMIKKVFFDFCDICRRNQINYTVLGRFLESDNINTVGRIKVAMTYGDIEKLSKIIETEPSCATIYLEGPENNSRANDFSYIFCDKNYTLINLIDSNSSEVCAPYITIEEIEKFIDKESRSELKDRLCEMQINFGERNRRTKFLRKRRCAKLIKERHELVAIASWKDIFESERVRIGGRVFRTSRLNVQKTMNVEGHSVSIVPFVADKIPARSPVKGMKYKMYDIPLPDITAEEAIKIIGYERWNRLLREEEEYEKDLAEIVDKNKILNRAYGTYLMAKDIVELRKRNVQNLSEEECKVLGEDYLRYVERYKNKKIDYETDMFLEELAMKYSRE